MLLVRPCSLQTGIIRPLQDPRFPMGKKKKKKECPSEQNQKQFSNVKDSGTGRDFVPKHPIGLRFFPPLLFEL